VLFISMPSYLVTTQRLPLSTGLLSTIVGLAVFVALVQPFAALSDRVGRRPVLIGGAVGSAVLAYPLYVVIGTGNPVLIFGAQVVAAVVLAAVSAPMPAVLVEAFPTRIRISSMAIAYGLATAVFSGTAPYVSTWLIAATGDARTPGLLVTAAALVTLVAAIVLRETHRDELAS
jgi:MHS family proline/betaine transporter-like MFS transporter